MNIYENKINAERDLENVTKKKQQKKRLKKENEINRKKLTREKSEG